MSQQTIEQLKHGIERMFIISKLYIPTYHTLCRQGYPLVLAGHFVQRPQIERKTTLFFRWPTSIGQLAW